MENKTNNTEIENSVQFTQKFQEKESVHRWMEVYLETRILCLCLFVPRTFYLSLPFWKNFKLNVFLAEANQLISHLGLRRIKIFLPHSVPCNVNKCVWTMNMKRKPQMKMKTKNSNELQMNLSSRTNTNYTFLPLIAPLP